MATGEPDGEDEHGQEAGEGVVGASLLVPQGIPRPACAGCTTGGIDGEWALEDEDLDYLTQPVVSLD
ncbi:MULTISPECIES: hypothetical protein [Streptomyces]|uniref:Uncharacterized protein n=1 Tax=Streptomyces ehimensis TaxID=68195 RepID=A0ABV9BUZ8_9ACTN